MTTDQDAPAATEPASGAADPLAAVRAAATAEIVAQVEGGDVAAAHERSLAAAREALDGGHAISAIAAAEAQGQQAGREQSGAQLLRTIERAARKQRDATEEYEQAVSKGVAIGLPTREIATRADVSHGTVGAIARRRGQSATEDAPPQGGE